jgi:hypothetical protein
MDHRSAIFVEPGRLGEGVMLRDVAGLGAKLAVGQAELMARLDRIIALLETLAADRESLGGSGGSDRPPREMTAGARRARGQKVTPLKMPAR